MKLFDLTTSHACASCLPIEIILKASAKSHKTHKTSLEGPVTGKERSTFNQVLWRLLLSVCKAVCQRNSVECRS